MKTGFETELAAFEDDIEDRLGENVEMGNLINFQSFSLALFHSKMFKAKDLKI
jgi:hypothetical protein